MVIRRVMSAVVLLLATGLPAGAQAVQPPAATPATVALVVKYADGRASYFLVSPRSASVWTPNFPRVSGWQTPDGSLPVAAIQFARVLVGQDVQVVVSVLLGQPHQEEKAVATVLVRPGARIIINELRRFGVQPVELWLTGASPFTPYPPTAISNARELAISFVDVLNAPYPGYRITVRNFSAKAVSNFRVQSYRGDRPALSAIRRGTDGHPVLAPGASYTFDLALTSGTLTEGTAAPPTPLDLIEIDSVLWEDGSFEGPRNTASVLVAVNAGQRVQLTRIIAALRNELSDSRGPAGLVRLRSRLEALPISVDDLARATAETTPLPPATAEFGMQQTKTAALIDLSRFERDRSRPLDTDTIEPWLRAMLARYETWLRRVTPL